MEESSGKTEIFSENFDASLLNLAWSEKFLGALIWDTLCAPMCDSFYRISQGNGTNLVTSFEKRHIGSPHLLYNFQEI